MKFRARPHPSPPGAAHGLRLPAALTRSDPAGAVGGIPINRDTVTGIVGAAILVAAMIGVFQYERTVGAARAGIGQDGAFELANLTGPVLSGSVTPGGAAWNEVANVSQLNLTTVTFTLTWTGDAALSLAVEPPAGLGQPKTADGSGTATVTFTIENPQPTAGAPGTLGTGDWKVSVAAAAPGGPTSQVPVVGAPQPVSFKVAIAYQAWEPAPPAAA